MHNLQFNPNGHCTPITMGIELYWHWEMSRKKNEGLLTWLSERNSTERLSGLYFAKIGGTLNCRVHSSEPWRVYGGPIPPEVLACVPILK
jgi:hypothetical protein